MKLRALLVVLLLAGAVAAGAAQSVPQDVLERLVRTIELADENPDAALEALARLAGRARKGSPAYVLIMQERMNLLLREDRIGDARAELEAAFAGEAPDFAPDLRLLLGQTLLYEARPEAARLQLELWRSQFEEPNPAGLFLLGYALIQLESFTEAAEALESALALDPSAERPQWIELLAYAYTRLGETKRAIALLEGMITRYPDNARWWQQLASNHLLRDALRPGTAALDVAALLEAQRFEDVRRRARLYASGGMPAEGAALLAPLLAEQARADFEDWMLLGEMWMLARETDYAIDAFERADGAGASGEPQLMIAQLHVLDERYALAEQALLRAVDGYGAADMPPRGWYLLAVVQIHLDDLDAAREALGHIEEDPAYAERGRRLAAHIAAVAG